MRKVIDMTGEIFGRLTVIKKSETTNATRCSFWICTCECGKTTDASRTNLIKGHTKSCGCLQIESRIKHDKSRTLEYAIWRGIKRRCLDTKLATYQQYGAKGITISDEWLSFETFIHDMGERPSKDYDIDRIDNTKGYSKDNCRWTTKAINAQNKSNSKRWVVNGIEYNSLNEASRETKISPSQINRMCNGYTHNKTGKVYEPKESCYCYNYYKGAV